MWYIVYISISILQYYMILLYIVELLSDYNNYCDCYDYMTPYTIITIMVLMLMLLISLLLSLQWCGGCEWPAWTLWRGEHGADAGTIRRAGLGYTFTYLVVFIVYLYCNSMYSVTTSTILNYNNYYNYIYRPGLRSQRTVRAYWSTPRRGGWSSCQSRYFPVRWRPRTSETISCSM